MSMLFIRKKEGDFDNILVRDVKTRVAAHIQTPVNATSRRVVVAMPAGKAALCFETVQAAGWSIVEGISPFADKDGQNGVQFALSSEAAQVSIPVPSILLHHTLMARFGIDPERKNENRLKDLIAGGGLPELESVLGMSLQDLAGRGQVVGPGSTTATGGIAFSRRALDGKHTYSLEFTPGPGTALRVASDQLHLRRQDPAAPLRLTVRASTDFERLTPMPFADLVNDQGRELARRDPQFAQAVRNFEFLSYREKFLAGSWNFLSYFGRDTLISLRLMWPVLSSEAKQTGIHSVLNEVSPDGIVNVTDEWTDDRAVMDALEGFFHAMDQRDLAGARQIMRTILEGRVPEHPFFDVLDQTFMYPSAVAGWFKECSDDRLKQWLRADHPVLGRTESNLATLLRNWDYILESAAPYVDAWRQFRARYPGLVPRQIIVAHLEEFKATGKALIRSIAGAANWRDTYNLPRRFYSEDINVNLLPMAIAAIQEMVIRIRTLGGGQELVALAKHHALDGVREYLEKAGAFDAAREAWNWDFMREHFLVRRTAEDMRRDLARYVEGLQNGDVFGRDRDRGIRERDALLRSRDGGVTVAEFLAGKRVPDGVKDGVEFTALFLDPAGRPLPIMHNDDVFLLLFGNPSLEQFRKIVRPLVLSYPFGLGFLEEDLGLAVTNAVYSPRDELALQDSHKNAWVKFGPDEYHGRAAWPWTLFALVNGIHDLVHKSIDGNGHLRNGVTADDVALFRKILIRMKSSLVKLGPLATSEVFKYAPAKAGEGVWQAEPLWISTPIQLWSAAPANLLIHAAMERVALAR